MLPHQTQDSFQHDGGDETTVIYSKLKITPEVKEEAADEKVKKEVDTEKGKEEVATQGGEKRKEQVVPGMDETVKEVAQTAEEMQRDGGELAIHSYKEMDEEESECIIARGILPLIA